MVHQKVYLFGELFYNGLGGIGVIVMAITILPLLNIGGMQLFKKESSDTTEKILPRTRKATLVIFVIYLA